MSREEYIEYLKSAEWNERRKMFMEEADWICSECGAKATQLHHLSYDNLGEEELDIDVVALCKECHEDIHDRSGEDYGEYGE